MFEGIVDSVVNAVTGKKKDKLEHVNDQVSGERDLAQYIKAEVEERRNTASRITSEGQWLTNAAYLLGFGNMYYDTSIRIFRPINLPSRQFKGTRVEFNFILPNIQNRLARLTKSAPRYEVKPNSTSDEDREAARLGEYIIAQVWDQQRVNKKRLAMMMSMQQNGFAFFKTSWDPALGPKMPMLNDEGKVIFKSLGDIRVDVVTAFEWFPDLLAKSQEELTSGIHAKIRPISYFRTQYPDRGHLVSPEGVWLQSLDYESRINSFNAQTGTGSGSNYVKNSAIELSYYETPNYKNPLGRHVIVANGVVLKDDTLPIDEVPFSKFDDILIGSRYNSESTITHLRNLQDQYNRNLTKRSQWLNRTLMGKFLAAKGHGLAKEAFNDQSGEIVEFNPVPNAPPPTYIQVPPIPSYAYQEDDYIKGMMNEICGNQEIDKGNLPSAGIPAIGMQYLSELSDTRIGTITENNEHAFADLGRHILKFVFKYYDYPRVLKIAGAGMEYAVKSFIGADLKGNFDVAVVRGSTLPGSKVLKRQEIINLHQQGYLGDPSDPKVRENVLNMLEYGDVSEAWKDHSLDMAQIQKHLKMIQDEIDPPVSEFDNHPLFIQELNRFRKSEKFETMSDLSKSKLFLCMERHLNEVTDMLHPATAQEGAETDPMMQESHSAQQMEAEIMAEPGPMGESMEAPMEEMPINIEQGPV